MRTLHAVRMGKWRCARLISLWMVLAVCMYLSVLYGDFASDQLRETFSGSSQDADERKLRIYGNLRDSGAADNFEKKTIENREIVVDSDEVTTNDAAEKEGLINVLEGNRRRSHGVDVDLEELVDNTEEINEDGENSEDEDTETEEDVYVEDNQYDEKMFSNIKEANFTQTLQEILKLPHPERLPWYLQPKNIAWSILRAGNYSPSLYRPPANEIPVQRFPQAIIIGVGKCGTRALLEFLMIHPYVVGPQPEMHFFEVDENFNKGLDWYRSQMPLSYSNQITIEKTPSYIWSDRAMNEIYKLNKNMKLIVIIKDPVVRVVSQALSNRSENIEDTFIRDKQGILSVRDDKRTVQRGRYVIDLKRWIHKFSRSQIYIVESSEFVKNPAKEIKQIEIFLGIPHRITERNFYFNTTKGFYCMRRFHKPAVKCLNEGKGIPHPPLDPLMEEMLYDYYKKYNEELFQLLGRRYRWEPNGGAAPH